MTLADLKAAEAFIEGQDISAVYPQPETFGARLRAAMATAQREADAVTTFAGYRATLKHFINSLDDEHADVRFPIAQTRLYWPGFVIRRIGGRYVTAASVVSGVADGQALSTCDGAPVDELVERTAVYEGGHPGLESTKASAALATMIDQGNPFLHRPTVCTIAGRPMKLEWMRIYYADYVRNVQSLGGHYDRTVAVSDLGNGVAWVRIGNFEPETQTEVADFRRVIAEAPSLRDKSAIVLDVRQNGGGPYDWMMAFLNSLYGKRYADFYARARLAIRPVYRATPAVLQMYRESDASDRALGAPTDKATDSDSTRGVAQALAQHRPVFKAAHSNTPPPLGEPPLSPVHAKVFVLTDYGCASVCIGFVDELKRFPGVKQIGTETFVDSRTGTPMTQTLPSGASINVPTMTRDGRPRGDNVPQRPDIRFDGDIDDNAAVQHWVLNEIAPDIAHAE